VTTVVAVLALSGCGGEDQSASEPSGRFKVDVLRTTFPARQHLAEQQRFVFDVRNSGDREIPNVAVTLDGFSTAADEPGLADRDRPVWIVEDGPRGGGTAYVDTWALGRLTPGQTRRFVWKVTAVAAGEHELRWRVAAGLTGKGQAVTGDDRAPEGKLMVHVDREPADARVDPKTGDVKRSY
jgi:hypothetical protein